MRICFDEMKEFFEKNSSFLLLCHQNPDGDTLGSAYALAKALQSMGKQARVEVDDKISSDFNFMLEGLEMQVFEPERVVAIDVADTKLLGDDYKIKYAQGIDLCIDHHSSNVLYAQKVYLEPDSASTAEIIFLLLNALNCDITPYIASCLFTGVTTDTGCFRFSNTTCRTYEIASCLVKKGADSYNIIQVFFETKSKKFAKLERLALDSMRFYFSEKCALVCITRDMFERSGTDICDCDRLANMPRQIEGVLVGVVMKEMKNGQFKVSVRTHGDIDASAICSRLSGGGHRGAAGCTLDGPKQAAINYVLKEVGAELDAVVID